MDYQDDNSQGDWYANSVDSDAEYAAQLQRQMDDEDLLSAQLSQSFNFLRPTLTQAHSSNPNTSNNLRNDEEIAKRIQRKFYLDMKKQGLSDLEIASMLDTLAPEHQQTELDLEMQMAVQASLGQDYIPPAQSQQQQGQPFLEKFLLILHTNCCHEYGANVAPSPNDDFSVFREHASKSVKEMSDEMLLSVKKIVELMLETLNFAQHWNEIESAFFIIDAISTQMNTSELNSTNERLIQFITNVPSNSNPLLINTTMSLIGNLSRWFYNNKEANEKCVSWLLNLPPYENLLLGISKVLEKLASLMHTDLADSFKQIFDYLPYVELTTDNGEEMEQAALNLIKCCCHLTNDRPSDQLVGCLEALLQKPVFALNELLSGNRNNDASPNSWHFFANNPSLWLNRIYTIYKTLHPWHLHNEYLNQKFNGEFPAAPWSALNENVCQVICRVIAANPNNQQLVEECFQCCLSLINSNLSNASTFLIGQLLTELMNIYSQQPQCYILKLANEIVDEFAVGSDAEQVIANFLNSVSIQTFESYSNVEDLQQNSELIRLLFVSVNSFTCLRINTFLDQPAAQLMFEMATYCLTIEQNELYKFSSRFIFMLLQFPRNQSSSQLTNALQNIELIMNNCFEKLLNTCIQIALFENSIDLIGTSSEVLSELLLFENQKAETYLGPCLYRLIEPYNLPIEEVQNFETQLKRSINGEEILNCFVAFSKNIRR